MVSAAAPAKKALATNPVQRWMATLTPRERVAQLIVIQIFGNLPPARSWAYRQFLKSVQIDGVGGIIVNNRVGRSGAITAKPIEMVSFLNRMQKLAKVPLLIGGDFEPGASMRVSGTVKCPHTALSGHADGSGIAGAGRS